MNLPNQLTIARLILVPLFVFFMSIHHEIAYLCGYIVFIVASITDYYDGKIARERGLVTNFGMLLDPLADKVLLSAGFVMLMQVPSLRIPGWTIVAILAREFLVTGARAMAASEGTVVAASKLGKWKTVVQMVYIDTFLFFVIAGQLLERWVPGKFGFYNPALGWASHVGIIFVALFTLYSGLQFARSNWKSLGLGNQI